MNYLAKFDFNEGSGSDDYGTFKIVVEAASSEEAREAMRKLIIDATENDDEFFEGGTTIWMKSFLRFESESLSQGTLFDFKQSPLGSPENATGHGLTYPSGKATYEMLEGREDPVDELTPFLVI